VGYDEVGIGLRNQIETKSKHLSERKENENEAEKQKGRGISQRCHHRYDCNLGCFDCARGSVAVMKFIPALDMLQAKKPKVLGIFQARNPTNVLIWNSKLHQFRTFYTNKPQVISRSMLFADDWDVILIPETPNHEFTQEVEENDETN